MRGLGASLVLVLVVAAPAARAAQVVHFVDGRSLEVERLTLDGGQARLAFADGGEMAVSLVRIARWESARPAAAPPVAGGGPAAEPWRSAAGDYADLIAHAARRHRLDPALLAAVAAAESSFDPRAVSAKGACGLLQLMPQTAERFGVADVFDAAQNVDGGARYLSWLIDRFEGRTDLALAGYNAGEGAVERYRGVPPYSETRTYVRRVLDIAGRLSGPAP